MTVQELRDRLAACPADAVVLVEYDSMIDKVEDVLVTDRAIVFFKDQRDVTQYAWEEQIAEYV